MVILKTVILKTERLALSLPEQSDAPFFLKLMTDETFIRNIGDRGVHTLDEAKAHIKDKLHNSYQVNGFCMYLATLKSTGEPVGVCGLVKRDTLDCPDIGYAFLPQYAGFGYATEAAKAVMAHGTSTLGIKRIVGITSAENQPSIKVLEKIGLRFDKMVPYSDDEESMLFIPR